MSIAAYQPELNPKFGTLHGTCGDKIDQFFATHPESLVT